VDREAPIVAVVDDEESVRKALARLLRLAGFGVQAYATGLEFIHCVEQRRPDLVVLDVHMPVMNGYDVQQALVRLGVGIPVVMITGEYSEERRRRARAQGALELLPKPVDSDLLLRIIQRALRGCAP
jgi:FixJ family two-component response regulator